MDGLLNASSEVSRYQIVAVAGFGAILVWLALRMYRRNYNEQREEYRVMPLHDWTSHYADAFRYIAVGYRPAPVYATRRYKRDSRWVV